MAKNIAGSYVKIDQSTTKTKKSKVNQLVDIVQLDIASTGSNNTRKSYEVFTSGGLNLANIKSSLYQTVHDQDFTLGTANPLFDITIGSLLEESGSTITINELSSNISRDSGGKLIGFDNSTAMMREKVNIYRQFAQNLLGDANASFFTPHSATAEVALGNNNAGTRAKKIRGAIFICFRRLFTRDNILKGSIGLRVHKNAARLYSDFLSSDAANRKTGIVSTNIDSQADASSDETTLNATYFIDDTLSLSSSTTSPVSGEISTLKDASGNHVGVVFYDSGIIVLDAERVFDEDQIIRGLIDSTRKTTPTLSVTSGPYYVYGDDIGNTNGEGYYYPLYTQSNNAFTDSIQIVPKNSDGTLGAQKTFYYDADSNPLPTLGSATRPTNIPLWTTSSDTFYSAQNTAEVDGKTIFNNKLYPDLWISGTVDNVLDHICKTRFGRGNLSAITFRNETEINSSLIYCKAAPSQLNYSTNPSYTDNNGKIIATSSNGDPFSYITTIGLYDASLELLAVAKTSRPIEKNPETDLSIRIRLDY